MLIWTKYFEHKMPKNMPLQNEAVINYEKKKWKLQQ